MHRKLCTLCGMSGFGAIFLVLIALVVIVCSAMVIADPRLLKKGADKAAVEVAARAVEAGGKAAEGAQAAGRALNSFAGRVRERVAERRARSGPDS